MIYSPLPDLTLSPSLISHMVSVDVKHHERRSRVSRSMQAVDEAVAQMSTDIGRFRFKLNSFFVFRLTLSLPCSSRRHSENDE